MSLGFCLVRYCIAKSRPQVAPLLKGAGGEADWGILYFESLHRKRSPSTPEHKFAIPNQRFGRSLPFNKGGNIRRNKIKKSLTVFKLQETK